MSDKRIGKNQFDSPHKFVESTWLGVGGSLLGGIGGAIFGGKARRKAKREGEDRRGGS